ncbi:MAG: VWA domain-containing protein, partial [Solirubrobacterales bacterium]|nr:VWA domain-containing protein [Solirubrobacterales bacterium]
VRRAAALALGHRRRRDPLDPHSGDPQQIQDALDGAEGPGGPPDPSPPAPPHGDDTPDRGELGGGVAPEQVSAPVPARIPAGAVTLWSRGHGEIDTRAGSDDVAVVSSLLHGEARSHVRSGRSGTLICLVLDASGSMGARRRAARVKGALLELLRDAYARRDEVAVIAFRDAAAEVVIEPGAPLEQAAAVLSALPTGGRTPLAEGLEAANELITVERRRFPERQALALVLTDGRAADPDGSVARAAHALGRAADAVNVVDLEDGPVRLGLASVLAEAAGAQVFELEVA